MLGRTARAQAWPNRPVRIIVPFPPGGGGDTIARIVGAKLTEIWGQQIIVENKGGAGGNIASDATARSAPDGYTLFLAGDFLATNQFIYPKLSYDPVADFATVSLVVRFPVVLVVPNSSPAQNFAEFMALAKSRSSDPLTYASPGYGTSPHLAAELLKREAEDRADPRPLSRRRTRDPGSDPGPRRQLLQQYRADRAADAAGPDPRHRGHQREARGRDAGPPDRRGIRPAGLRRVGLVRLRDTCEARRPRSSPRCMPTP